MLNVKKKLAAVTYFKYYGPNRVVVREQQEACALYFLLTGQCTITKLTYDGLLKEYFPMEVYQAKPGDIIGEVSLLHGIPRTSTVTTLDHCEFLILYKHDFKLVLQNTIQQYWDRILEGMDYFSYFRNFDLVSRREGCVLAKLVRYDENETLVGDDEPDNKFVFFLTMGRCQLIESLKIEPIRIGGGRTQYKLHDDVDRPQSTVELPVENVTDIIRNINHYENIYKLNTKSRLSVNFTEHSTLPGMKTLRCGCTYPEEKLREVGILHDEVLPETLYSNTILNTLRDTTEPSMRMFMPYELPRVKTYFMQICIYNKGSTFNLGESMRDRRIVALEPVECLALPRVWLMQQNHANIWTRLKYYLQKTLPTKKALFREFVRQQKWQEFCDKKVNEVVSRKNIRNTTTVHDVPYSIRMTSLSMVEKCVDKMKRIPGLVEATAWPPT